MGWQYNIGNMGIIIVFAIVLITILLFIVAPVFMTIISLLIILTLIYELKNAPLMPQNYEEKEEITD